MRLATQKTVLNSSSRFSRQSAAGEQPAAFLTTHKSQTNPKGIPKCFAYANKKIEDLDNRRKTLSKAIADLSVETLSSQQIELLSGYLDDWENISFEDKRKAADGLISSISATSDYVKIEWKI